jgi:nitrous oxide reductase accessory protein NosL
LHGSKKPSQATDFSNGKLINAHSAFYLEGSDLMQCCASTTMRTDSGMIYDMHYDRCMPSLVAFANLKNAQAYQQEHGGRLIDLAEAKTSVARQMGE